MLKSILSLLMLLAPIFSKAAPNYVLVQVGEGSWKLSISGHAALVKDVEATHQALAEDKKAKRNETGGLIVQKAQYPSFMNSTETLSFLTVDGVRSQKIKKAGIWEGCSTIDFVATLDGKGSAKDGALAVGILNGQFPPKAYLKPLSITTGKDHLPIADKIYANLLVARDPKIKEELLKEKISVRSLKFAPVKLGQGVSWIVWLDAKGKGYGQSPDPHYFVYAALVGADGGIKSELAAFDSQGTGWVPEMITDLNGDGVEEVLGRPFYYEGESKVILEAKGGKFEQTVIYSVGC